MTKVIDITGRQAEKEKSYAHSAFNEFWANMVGEFGVILRKEVDPAYYEQVRKELLLTARKYAHKSRQRGASDNGIH